MRDLILELTLDDLLETNNVVSFTFTYYKWNNFGHITIDCRLQVNRSGPRYGNSIFTCYKLNNLGHLARWCKFNSFVNGRRNNGSSQVNYENINKTFVKESKGENEKV